MHLYLMKHKVTWVWKYLHFMSGLWKLRYDLSMHIEKRKLQKNFNWHIYTEAKICPLSDMLTIVTEIWFYTVFFSRVATKFAGYTIKTGKTGERQKKKWADNILLIYFHLYIQRSFKKPHKDILRFRKGVSLLVQKLLPVFRLFSAKM